MTAKVYTFAASRDAYEAVQVGDVPVGGILHIPSERIFGVADTWPFSVSEAYGSLHGLYLHPREWGFYGTLYTADEVAILAESADRAIAECIAHAYLLADWVTS